MIRIFGTSESLDLNITLGGIVAHYFTPVILPVILLMASVTVWAYCVSQNKLKEYRLIPILLLIAAVAIAIIFRLQ
jgi:hypothetical protein